MQKLTKTGDIIASSWQPLAKDSELNIEELSTGLWLIHINQYLQHKEQLRVMANVGAWLDSDDSPESAAGIVDNLIAIGIHFPVFGDGRGFSIGRTLKQQYQFSGELCALGNFMQDQLFYLTRCGFDAFLLAETSNITAQTLNEFSDFYQAAEDQPQPLFRRRKIKTA